LGGNGAAAQEAADDTLVCKATGSCKTQSAATLPWLELTSARAGAAIWPGRSMEGQWRGNRGAQKGVLARWVCMGRAVRGCTVSSGIGSKTTSPSTAYVLHWPWRRIERVEKVSLGQGPAAVRARIIPQHTDDDTDVPRTAPWPAGARQIGGGRALGLCAVLVESSPASWPLSLSKPLPEKTKPSDAACVPPMHLSLL